MTGTERRSEILDQVRQCVCRDRQNTYGDAEDNFATIAKLWNTWITTRYVACPGPRLDARDVAMMSALIKVARAGTSPDHLDNWIDLAGYAVCGGGIVKAKGETPVERRCDVTSLGNPTVQCWLNAGHSGPHLFINPMSKSDPDAAAPTCGKCGRNLVSLGGETTCGNLKCDWCAVSPPPDAQKQLSQKCHQCGSELGTNPRCAACAVFAGDEKMPCPKQQMVGISTARCSSIAEPNRQCVLGAGHSGQHVFAP